MSTSNTTETPKYPVGIPHGKHVYAIGFDDGDIIYTSPHPQIAHEVLEKAKSYSKKSMAYPFSGMYTHTFTVSPESKDPIGLSKAVIQTIAYHATSGSEIIVNLPHNMGTVYYGVKDRPSWDSARIGKIYPHIGDEFLARFG